MPTAEELLNSLSAEEPKFTIDSEMRTISVPSGQGIAGVVNDKDVNRIHFQCPRYVDETDLADFSCRINYINAIGSEDVYVVSDMRAEADRMTFSWLLGSKVFEGEGSVSFTVCMRKLGADGMVAKEYNTTIATMRILPGIETEPGITDDRESFTDSLIALVDAKIEGISGGADVPDDIGRRLELLEAAAVGKLYVYETDETEAYEKAVPDGAMKYASVDEVGGKTVVWNQLTPFPDGLSVTSGTKAINGNEITVTCLDADSSWKQLLLFVGQPGSWCNSGDKIFQTCEIYVDDDTDFILRFRQGTNTLTMNSGRYSCRAGSWTTLSRISTLESGKDWSKIGGGVGPEPIQQSGFRYKARNFVMVNMTKLFGKDNEPTNVNDPRIAWIKAYAASHPEYNPCELLSAKVSEVESRSANNATLRGFDIPQSVRDICPMYGASAGNAYNYIDFENKKYVQRVASVDLGTLVWSFSSSNGWFYTPASRFGANSVSSNNETPNITCANYMTASRAEIKDGFATINTTPNLLVIDEGYNGDAETFKTSMSGVMLYYELATPIEVDLSSVLSDDNSIEVEAGGTLEFKQANGTRLPVPSKETYVIKIADAL